MFLNLYYDLRNIPNLRLLLKHWVWAFDSFTVVHIACLDKGPGPAFCSACFAVHPAPSSHVSADCIRGFASNGFVCIAEGQIRNIAVLRSQKLRCVWPLRPHTLIRRYLDPLGMKALNTRMVGGLGKQLCAPDVAAWMLW